MRRFALIGEKLGHSASVPLHRAIWRETGIEADYRLVEITRDDFAALVTHPMRETDGFNITIPYKVDIMPLLSHVDSAAAAMGAVNTVVCGEHPHGHNTDAPGLAAMLRHYGMDPAGQPVWILGTGGASKAARYVAEAMGASEVHLVSRTPHDGACSYDELAERGSGVVIYWKDTQRIEDFLTTIGAPRAAMALMEGKVEKQIRNEINRQVNCETANMIKVTAASAKQIAAIERALVLRGIEIFPENLRDTVDLRVAHPTASLAELAAMFDPPLSKPGLNHRLRKIMEIAGQVEEGE